MRELKRSMYDIEKVRVETLNEKGYGVANYNGKPLYILNALPGELVIPTIVKRKKGAYYSYVKEGNIIETSRARTSPSEEAFLATSPLQILAYPEQILFKERLIKEFYFTYPQFKEEGTKDLIENLKVIPSPDAKLFKYRNKIEFAFYTEDESISLAFYKRDSKNGKVKVKGSSLISERMNNAARKIIDSLNSSYKEKLLEGRELKSLLLRESLFENKIVAILYVKSTTVNVDLLKELFDKLVSSEVLKGYTLNYSDPRSPASVTTNTLWSSENSDLVEKVGESKFTYSPESFFQINIGMFNTALLDIKQSLIQLGADLSEAKCLDIYAGVGSIGIPLSQLFQEMCGVELHSESKKYAMLNSKINDVNNYTFYQGAAEKVLLEMVGVEGYEYVILDPPRSGLHPNVIKVLLESAPQYILYMSCNPKTQAVDLSHLMNSGKYKLLSIKGYDFYPQTPHVECFAILKRTI